MTSRYLGNSTLHDVVITVQKDKDGNTTILLFRAHTSEPYGELQIPRGHAKALAAVLTKDA